jgi:hypothetical protein
MQKSKCKRCEGANNHNVCILHFAFCIQVGDFLLEVGSWELTGFFASSENQEALTDPPSQCGVTGPETTDPLEERQSPDGR